jgi:hypothetical protein
MNVTITIALLLVFLNYAPSFCAARYGRRGGLNGKANFPLQPQCKPQSGNRKKRFTKVDPSVNSNVRSTSCSFFVYSCIVG